MAQQEVTHLGGTSDAAGMRLQLVCGNIPGAAVDQQLRSGQAGVVNHSHHRAREAGRKAPAPWGGSRSTAAVAFASLTSAR